MKQTTHPVRSYAVNRRRAIQLGAVGVGIGLAGLPLGAVIARADVTPSASPVPASDIPVSGQAVPELAEFDALITKIMSKWNFPGGQLSITREARLVYNRGFGYASVEDGEVVEPDMTFRIASNTKPITAVAIMKLIDAGEIKLDTPVFPLLALEGPANAPYDARLDTITIEQLLVHSGGWNSAATGIDPQYLPWPALASHLLDAESPPNPETIIRYMLSQPLDCDPGTISAYSNFGFNVLGRVIEHLSGQAYDDFVIDGVLAPAGVTTMAIGGTTLEERLPGEVRYYSPPGLPTSPSVYPGEGFVPAGYGSYYMPGLDAHGGWIGSAEDLVRICLAVDGARGEPLLSPEAVTAMETTQRPPSASSGAGNVEGGFGLGWNSVAVDGGYEWSHAGALEGSNCSWIVRKPGGIALAFVFNSLPEDYGAFFNEIFPAIQGVISETTEWPDTDQFG